MSTCFVLVESSDEAVNFLDIFVIEIIINADIDIVGVCFGIIETLIVNTRRCVIAKDISQVVCVCAVTNTVKCLRQFVYLLAHPLCPFVK